MVDLGCGARCAKLIVLLINFFFALIGILLLGFGIFLVVDTKALHNQYFLPVGASADQIIIAAGIILSAGLVILLITIVGCCATCKEHTCCLTFYSVILILLLILQVSAVIVAGVFYDQVIESADETMMKFVQFEYGQEGHNTSTDFIDFLQSELYCCGVSDGPLDWKTSAWHNTTKETVPKSCCKTEGNKGVIDLQKCRAKAYDETSPDRSAYVYTEGCDAKFDRLVKKYVGILIGIVIGVVVIQIVFIVVTCLLKSSIARGYEYV